MLGNYLKFNDAVFPNPVTSKKSSKTIENVNQSEAGTDLVAVVRASKLSWTFSFDLSPAKKAVLENLCKDESTQMFYQGNTYKVRVRDYQEELVEGSEWMTSVEGLFKCSVKVTEF